MSPGFGRTALTASFSDGSAGLLPIAVPEPAGAAAPALALLLLRASRHR